jgi:transcriptional regulator GlxA family with amidase domain
MAHCKERVSPAPDGARRPFRVAFILVPGFSLMALSSAVEPLRAVNRLVGEQRFEWVVIGPAAGPVAASNGLEVRAACAIGGAPPADLTIVVASLDVETYRDHALFEHLRRLRAQHRLIGAISNGTLILARAGVLGGRRVTIHWEMQGSLMAEFPDLDVCSNLYCWDLDVLTAAGGSAAMDMMLELIAVRDGRDTAVDVSEQFLHGPARPGNELQRQDVRWRYCLTDQRVETAIRVMEDQLTSPLRIARVAELAGVSERQLERLFGDAFGKSPSQFYLELRLKEARSRLLASSETLQEIAETMGFSSQAHFSRAVKAWCGASPLAIRKRRTSGDVGMMQGNGDSE